MNTSFDGLGAPWPSSRLPDPTRSFPGDLRTQGFPDRVHSLVSLPHLLGEDPRDDDAVHHRGAGFAVTAERLAPLLYSLSETGGQAWRIGGNRRQVHSPAPQQR